MSILNRIEAGPDRPALVWHDEVLSYGHLIDAAKELVSEFRAAGIGSGSSIAVIGDYSPSMVAAHLALLELCAVTVPLPTTLHAEDRDLKLRLARVEQVVSVASDDSWALSPGPGGARPYLFEVLIETGHPGFVVFTSGTTGEPKAVLHDFARFARQYDKPRRTNITLAIFAPDHLAGLATLFNALLTGSLLVCVADRSPSTVCAAIERYGVQFLPTSPTFLQLLLLAEAHRDFDLSSLELVTFGSEPMHEHILARLKEALPSTRFHQVYGISEINNLRSEPRAPGSNWVRLREDNYNVKIKDGRLWVKTDAAMLGYLNAPSPFDEDGWFDTGDVVETDGEFIRVLGRETEIINVGGDKVHPSEVEEVILSMENVKDVTVFGEAHPIVGQIVAARVVLERSEALADFRRRMRKHCAQRLARYKVPVRVALADHTEHSERFKRTRRPAGASPPAAPGAAPPWGAPAPMPARRPAAPHTVPR
jgi:long-chain acyl-CoA synthetase